MVTRLMEVLEITNVQGRPQIAYTNPSIVQYDLIYLHDHGVVKSSGLPKLIKLVVDAFSALLERLTHLTVDIQMNRTDTVHLTVLEVCCEFHCPSHLPCREILYIFYAAWKLKRIHLAFLFSKCGDCHDNERSDVLVA